ncbi:MAG: hypothetical protein MZV65_29745 [Chromatiales bacterium]|nr:hypothetical protein [Chromatiales bacterium]
MPFAALDNGWIDAGRAHGSASSTGLLLSGTLAALLFAYLRAVPARWRCSRVEAGLSRIRPQHGRGRALARHRRPAGAAGAVHLPMLRGSLLTAVLLVFVDVLKELPVDPDDCARSTSTPWRCATFELASDERLADAAALPRWPSCWPASCR